MSTPRRTRGFTLLETVVALTLLAVMLAMLFAGLRMAIRSWEAGSGRGDRADQVALAWSFVRRDLAAAFPWRFKDPAEVRLAFRGEGERLRFVSMRPADIGGGGLAFVALEYERPRGGRQSGRLVMRRVLAQAASTDFALIDEAERFTLLDGVSEAKFEYFGAEGDTTAATWSSRWEYPQRLPSHVRLAVKIGEEKLPDMVVALLLGEEAGCYESSFQRVCVPRR